MSPLNQTTTARAQKPDDLQTKSAKLPIKIDQRACRATDAAACVKMCIHSATGKGKVTIKDAGLPMSMISLMISVSIMIRTPDIENLAPYMETESNSRYLVCLMDC